MADITNELMYEVLRLSKLVLSQVDGKADENKHDMQALRAQMLGIHHDSAQQFIRNSAAFTQRLSGTNSGLTA